MNPVDVALQTAVPTVMVPKLSTIEPLQEAGHRFLASSNGLWLDVKRSWLSLIVPLSVQKTVAMPYGELESVMEFSFGKLPRALVEEFIKEARACTPNECAGWIIWNKSTGSMRLQMLENISVGRASVHFHRPVLSVDEEMVIDIHSHGLIPAFFSAEDDADDAGEVKISVVVGNCDRDEVSINVRLCALGLFLALPPPAMKDVIKEMSDEAFP